MRIFFEKFYLDIYKTYSHTHVHSCQHLEFKNTKTDFLFTCRNKKIMTFIYIDVFLWHRNLYLVYVTFDAQHQIKYVKTKALYWPLVLNL